MVQPAVTRAAKGQAVLLLVGTVFVVGKIGLFEEQCFFFNINNQTGSVQPP